MSKKHGRTVTLEEWTNNKITDKCSIKLASLLPMLVDNVAHFESQRHGCGPECCKGVQRSYTIWFD